MEYFYLTDPGKVRERNEDSVLIIKNDFDEYLLIVADGMGGHTGGEIASNIIFIWKIDKDSKLRPLNPNDLYKS